MVSGMRPVRPGLFRMSRNVSRERAETVDGTVPTMRASTSRTCLHSSSGNSVEAK